MGYDDTKFFRSYISVINERNERIVGVPDGDRERHTDVGLGQVQAYNP